MADCQNFALLQSQAFFEKQPANLALTRNFDTLANSRCMDNNFATALKLLAYRNIFHILHITVTKYEATAAPLLAEGRGGGKLEDSYECLQQLCFEGLQNHGPALALHPTELLQNHLQCGRPRIKYLCHQGPGFGISCNSPVDKDMP